MKIVKIKGGLGNQLFQYAFAKFLSIKTKDAVKIDNGVNTNKQDTYRQYGLDKFNIGLELSSREESLGAKYPFGILSKIWIGVKTKIFKIYNIKWNESILNSKETYFDGYWQSYKYLEPIRDILLKELTLKESIDNKYKDILDQINSSESVSLHVRRGDYATNPKTKAQFQTFGLEYYANAIEIISSKIKQPSFFIFSDDIEWVKQNTKISFPTVFVSNPNIKDYEELIIMSKCKNNIIANSSFSFWGAWLNQNLNKIVIAPKKWDNLFDKEYKDLLPIEWIRV